MTAVQLDTTEPTPTPAQADLLSRHYDEFRALARKVLAGDSARVRMQPTELAHEAAIRMMGMTRLKMHDRVHFLAMSARVMRQTLIDEVRRARAAKRQMPSVLTMWPGAEEPAVDIEALDRALTALAKESAGYARIVELRFFAGLTVEEIAGVLGESESTVKRRWRSARAWLLDQLDTAA